jgi:hypothetical protein
MINCVKQFAESCKPDWLDAAAGCGIFVVVGRSKVSTWREAAYATALVGSYVILKNAIVYKPLSLGCQWLIEQIPADRLLKKIGFEI